MGASFCDDGPTGSASSKLAPLRCSYKVVHWPGASEARP